MSQGQAGAPADFGEAVGTFTFTLTAAVGQRPGYTSLLGRVYERAVPAAVEWLESARSGECALLEPRLPFCSPACDVGAVCADDDDCRPYPALLDVGSVAIAGMGARFSVEPIAGSYQLSGGRTLPSPPCTEGAAFSLSASGSESPHFELDGTCIAPLVLLGAEELPFGKSALPLEWEASHVSASRVRVRIDVSHHGGTKGLIVCDMADDGNGEVEAGLVAGLLGLGTAGFPSLRAERVGRTSRSLSSGELALELVSPVARSLAIDGVVSCASAADCPEGTSCGPDRACH